MVQDKAVGGGETADHRLPEARSSVNNELAPRSRHGVGGEYDPRHLGGDEPLDDDGDGGPFVVKALTLPVSDGARRPREAQQRRTAPSSSSPPRTFSDVACWPAKLAPGRSSVVALERTATGGTPRER